MIDLQNELAETISLENISETQFIGIFTPPKNLSYFIGHFPDFPVLPAIALVDINAYIVKNLILFNLNLSIKKIDCLKIKSPIGPLQKINFKISKKEDLSFEIEWFEFENNEKMLSEISFCFH
jgi:3-hydroxymyristoyl/3-hydroxydecanoyl-(acyl carrier protein) dehydratase